MNVQVAAFRRTNVHLDVGVAERKDQPGVWSVEAIAMDDDGAVYQAHFFGPDAKGRAEEYASFKYGV